MDDSINRQEAIEFFLAKGMVTAAIYVERMPSAHSSIITCIECIHWKHSSARKNYCDVFDWVSKPNDFCSFAERKQDANNDWCEWKND